LAAIFEEVSFDKSPKIPRKSRVISLNSPTRHIAEQGLVQKPRKAGAAQSYINNFEQLKRRSLRDKRHPNVDI